MSKMRVTSEAFSLCLDSDEFVKTCKDLLVLRETVQLTLGENEFTFSNDLEDTAP